MLPANSRNRRNFARGQFFAPEKGGPRGGRQRFIVHCPVIISLEGEKGGAGNRLATCPEPGVFFFRELALRRVVCTPKGRGTIRGVHGFDFWGKGGGKKETTSSVWGRPVWPGRGPTDGPVVSPCSPNSKGPPSFLHAAWRFGPRGSTSENGGTPLRFVGGLTGLSGFPRRGLISRPWGKGLCRFTLPHGSGTGLSVFGPFTRAKKLRILAGPGIDISAAKNPSVGRLGRLDLGGRGIGGGGRLPRQVLSRDWNERKFCRARRLDGFSPPQVAAQVSPTPKSPGKGVFKRSC